MAEDLIVPPAMEEVIATFDGASGALGPHAIKQALNAARNSLVSPNEAENVGAWAEVLAFALVGSRHHASPWKTYFGPMASGVNSEGAKVYFPDIVGTDAHVIGHWTQRAKASQHPVLRARYADLAWDMSRAIAKTNPDPEMARIAVDAYVAAIAGRSCPTIHDLFEAALRALDLAVMINDTARVDTARSALLELHRGVVAADQALWWIAVDRLIDEKRAGVTDAERDQLVTDLEAIVSRRSGISDPKSFDPHVTEDAARRLIKFYSRRGRGGDARRLHEVIARSAEHFASLGDAMLASAVLQTAVNAYREAGLPKESSRARVLMEEKIAESHKEMQPISVDRTISKDDMEQFLQSVIAVDIGTTFVRIASEFVQRRSELEKLVTELAERAPLMAMMTQTIVADDHVAAKVGSVEDDPFGRLIQQAAQGISLSDIWLVTALNRAIEVHDIRPGHFVTWAARSGLYDDLTLLTEGVTAFYGEDFVKALHVLVPQVEVGLRTIVSQLGKPTTKPHSAVAGVSVAIGMGDMLYSKEVTDALGPDVSLHLLTLYSDPRGFNLRNDIAHGLLPADRIQFALASRVMHTLLVLGIWNQLAAARRGGG